MYGTIARARVKRDKIRDLMALGKDWDQRERRRAVGYLGMELLWSAANDLEVWMVIHFTSEQAYKVNADSPEQDAFYRRMRECLESDPEWHDGTFGRWDSEASQVPNLAKILGTD